MASCRVVNTPLSGPLSGPLSEEVVTLPVAEVAARLAVPPSRVQQYVRDGQLLGVRREGTVAVPEEFLDGNTVVKGLPGTITVLRDGGYNDDEILRWLFADDDSLPRTLTRPRVPKNSADLGQMT